MLEQKMKFPLVSVILLSYNHSQYVAQAVESVLNQTFKNFELLIADDGSNDNSREIIAAFTDKRIRFFLHEQNRGPLTVLAECFKAAQGQYIAIHHSDDLWKVEKLEKQINFLENNREYAACFTWVEIIDELGKPYNLSAENNYYAIFEQFNRPREQWLHDFFFTGNCLCHPSVVLRNRKNLYQDLYGVSGLWQLPDYSAWIRLLLKSNIYVLEERLTLFRLRRRKQENTSAESSATIVRSEMELYRVLKEYLRISNPNEFLNVFPEAQQYVVAGNILPQFALAKLLQHSQGAARKLEALDILFDLINAPKTAKKLSEWYGYDERAFVRENAESGILCIENMKFIRSRLYFDTGDGFNEMNCRSASVFVRNDGNFFAEFILNETNICALRFDPVENEPISMKLIAVEINGDKVNFNAVQPFIEKDGEQTFLTYDPQYQLHYTGNGAVRIQIQGVISKVNNALVVMEELRRTTEQENRNLKIKIQECNTRIAGLENSLDNANQMRQELSNQLNTIFNSRGYRFLKKYYSLRDRLLPRGSIGRAIVKNLVWAVSHPRLVGDLLTRENLSKLITALKFGGLRQAIIRADEKLHSLKTAGIEQEILLEYGNDWLKSRGNYSPPDNVTIDILMPIYNAYDFTRKCLESVYSNTDVHFCLYLINDHSTDKRIDELLKEVRQWQINPLMKTLQVLDNEENLGFIGSVNRGLKQSKNDVVLLNTDTEVPPHWLSRLIRPMLEDEKVASVTPFSNSAEICSFPDFCRNNDLPDGLTVTALDEIFARYGDRRICKIPTGVGFCMLMRRRCIEQFGMFDPVFGKGYGEENDWCRRTAAAGYYHVHVRNLFVWHKHGASFSVLKDKSKQQRLNENLAIISKRYPDYQRLVNEYIQADPAKNNRNFLFHCAKAKASKLQGVMFLNHSLGGGTKVYQDRRIAELKSSWRVYSMSPLADGRTLSIMSYYGEEEAVHIANFDLHAMDSGQFGELMAALKINWLFVNHLLTYPLPDIFHWIIDSKIPYTFFGHDFFAVCPRYQLLNSSLEYCGAETDMKKCRKCLSGNNVNFTANVDIEEWRQNFEVFLAGAKEVVVPSSDTKSIFQKYYSIPLKVHEHEIDHYLTPTFQADFAKNEILTIAVIGAIGDEKGAKILYKLADSIDKIALPIKLIVIGITNLHNEFYRSQSGKFEITGRYSNQDISRLLAQYNVSLVLIPSIWPETYSYTTTEAMQSGYPVMCFSLGAPADRVKRTGGGWILRDISEEAAREKIIELFNNRDEIIEKAQNLQANLQNP